MAIGINYAADRLMKSIVTELNESRLPICVIRAMLESLLIEARQVEQKQIDAEQASAEGEG